MCAQREVANNMDSPILSRVDRRHFISTGCHKPVPAHHGFRHICWDCKILPKHKHIHLLSVYKPFDWCLTSHMGTREYVAYIRRHRCWRRRPVVNLSFSSRRLRVMCTYSAFSAVVYRGGGVSPYIHCMCMCEGPPLQRPTNTRAHSCWTSAHDLPLKEKQLFAFSVQRHLRKLQRIILQLACLSFPRAPFEARQQVTWLLTFVEHLAKSPWPLVHLVAEVATRKDREKPWNWGPGIVWVWSAHSALNSSSWN